MTLTKQTQVRERTTHNKQHVLLLLANGFTVKSAALNDRDELLVTFHDDEALANDGVVGTANMYQRMPFRTVDKRRAEKQYEEILDSVKHAVLVEAIDAALAVADRACADAVRFGNMSFRQQLQTAIRQKSPSGIAESGVQAKNWVANVLRRKERTNRLIAAMGAAGD